MQNPTNLESATVTPEPPLSEEKLSAWTIPGGYTLKIVDRYEEPLFRNLTQKFFYEDFPSVNWESFLSEEERATKKELEKGFRDRYSLRIGAFLGDELVGWSYGWQDSEYSFYMGTSGVLPEHRRRGIYSHLVQGVIRIATERGFQIIKSRHVATNNAVIIPKLKAGFVFTAMELSDAFGMLVHLSYFKNKGRRNLLDVRAGLSRPDDEIRKVLWTSSNKENGRQ